MELKPGADFNGYHLIRLLGKGGFGSVYEAVKKDSDGKVDQRAALKVLHPAHAKDEKVVHRFHREARLAQKLNHPHTVKIMDSGTHEDNHFILMEYVEGKTLLDFMKPPDPRLHSFTEESTQILTVVQDDKTLSVEELPTLKIEVKASGDRTLAFRHSPVPSKEFTLKLIRQCAEALEAASRAGLVHRDIKPENILVQDLNGEPHVKILDFGLAKNLIDQSIQLSMDGQAMGTPAYMSPEQWKGEALDTRADLYSLGASFYTFVTGEKAFPSTSMKDLMRQILVEKTQRADEAAPSVDKDIADLLEKMMMKDPRDRFQTSADLIKAIDQLADQTKAFSAFVPALSEKQPLALWFCLALIVVFLLAAGVFLFMRPGVPLEPLADKSILVTTPLKETVFLPEQALPSVDPSKKTVSETILPVSFSSQAELPPKTEEISKSREDSSQPESSLPLEQTAIPSPLTRDRTSSAPPKKVVSGFSEDLKGEIQTKESDRFKKLLSQKNAQNNSYQP